MKPHSTESLASHTEPVKKSPKLAPQGMIDIDALTIPERKRNVTKAGVEALKASIAKVGLLQPVVVWNDSGKPTLSGGQHRVQAMRELGHTRIAYRLSTAKNALEAELAQLDENLVRSELSPSQRAAWQLRRKEVYLQLNPKSDKKGGGGGAKGGKANKPESYQSHAAKIQRVAPRTIEKQVAVADNLKEAGVDVAELAGTPLDAERTLHQIGRIAKEQPEAARVIAEAAIEEGPETPKAESKAAALLDIATAGVHVTELEETPLDDPEALREVAELAKDDPEAAREVVQEAVQEKGTKPEASKVRAKLKAKVAEKPKTAKAASGAAVLKIQEPRETRRETPPEPMDYAAVEETRLARLGEARDLLGTVALNLGMLPASKLDDAFARILDLNRFVNTFKVACTEELAPQPVEG
jgi:hypothetical protein